MSSLQITKVTLKHNGNYTCIASNTAATVSWERQLIVTGGGGRRSGESDQLRSGICPASRVGESRSAASSHLSDSQCRRVLWSSPTIRTVSTAKLGCSTVPWRATLPPKSCGNTPKVKCLLATVGKSRRILPHKPVHNPGSWCDLLKSHLVLGSICTRRRLWGGVDCRLYFISLWWCCRCWEPSAVPPRPSHRPHPDHVQRLPAHPPRAGGRPRLLPVSGLQRRGLRHQQEHDPHCQE